MTSRRLLIVLGLCLGCDLDLPTRSPSRPSGARTESPHTALGVPTDGSVQDEILLIHPQFTLSYNRFRNGPNWVSWRQRVEDMGSTGRTQERFSPDPMLPEGVYAVHHGDYTGSGFDRGHLCPSSARTANVPDNAATFLTTNLLPQRHWVNAGAWEALELFSSERARRGSDLYIIAGGLWDYGCATQLGNTVSSACPTLGRSADQARRVAIPRGFWKVVVVLPRDAGPQSVTESTEVIAVEMSNDGSVGADWQPYRTTVDAIERDTGYELLGAVSIPVQRVLEARVAPP